MINSLYQEYGGLSKSDLNLKFSNSCEFGDIHSVKYLLASDELKEHADVHFSEDFGFRIACRKGHLDIVRYLTCSPNLKEHAIINADDDYAFKWAVYHKHYDIIRFLIFELNIAKSFSIEKHLVGENCDDVINMFKIREFNMELNKHLPLIDIKSKKIKL